MKRFFADRTPLRESPQFRLLFLGMAFSDLGRQMVIVALPYQVYVLTGSSVQVGLISLTQVLPHIVGALVGGTVADAMDRRRLLLVLQGLLGSTALGLAASAALPGARIWHLHLLAVLIASLHGADNPARNATVPRIVHAPVMPAAFALVQLMRQTVFVVGPAVGGVLIAGFGLAVVYGAVVVSFLTSALVVARMQAMPAGEHATRAGLQSLLVGLRFLRGRPLLISNFAVDLNAMVFAMPRALFPEIGLVLLAGDASTVGLLYAAPGLGAMLGALTSGWIGGVRRQGRAVILAVAVWGASMAMLGLARSVVVAVLVLVVAGAANVVSAVFRTTILQATVPDELRGRLSALHHSVTGGGPKLGEAQAGLVAGITGVRIAVVGGGTACLAGLALIAWRAPAYWRFEAGGS